MLSSDAYMLKLQDICSMCLDRGTLVIMGDFNAHTNGQRFRKHHDRHSHILNQFVPGNIFSISNQYLYNVQVYVCFLLWSVYVNG